MSLNNYIDSLTKIDKTKGVCNANWTKVQQQGKRKSKPSSFRGRGEMPYQYELESGNQGTSHRRVKNFPREPKVNSYETYQDSKAKYGNHRLAEIVPKVREAVGGYNTFSNNAIERRFKENKLKYNTATEESTSTVYETATSKSTDESFNTALGSLNLSTDQTKDEAAGCENKSKTSCVDSSTDMSVDLINTSQDNEDDKKDWDNEESDEAMYNRRITRYFQSAEDEEVYVHPLKEQVQKDPEWQKFQLSRKGTKTIQTPRQHYLDLDDDSFNFVPTTSA